MEYASLNSVVRPESGVDHVTAAARPALPRGCSASNATARSSSQGMRRVQGVAAVTDTAPSLAAPQGQSTATTYPTIRKRGGQDVIKEEEDDGSADIRPRKAAKLRGEETSREC